VPVRTWYNSFYNGAVLAIGDRLRALKLQHMAEPSSRALVLNRAALVRQARAKLMPRTNIGYYRSTNYNANAYHQGRKARGSITLDRPIKGSGARPQLGGN
jgi:hypothetical protein